MSISKFFGAIALTLVMSITSWAGEEPVTSEKLSLRSSQAMKVSAVVESVDYESREVTLRDSSSELIAFVAGEEMQNLEQMKPGDVVIAEYMENFYIDVVESLGAEPGEGEFAALGSAEKGGKPGVTAFDSQTVTAMIEEINLEAGTYKLKWPDGSTEELAALNPENLTKGEVGDMVVITKTSSISISVEDSSAK
ncbi:MAG: hypothetical protein ACI9H8_001565 [Lysobacterales bacterium]|jgi:hypothetical protein